MTSPNQLSPLLTALADLFATENRPGGDENARALRACAALATDLPRTGPGPLAAHLHTALSGDPHPISPLVRQAAPWLVWTYSELGGRIRSDIARGMMQVELLGPDGMFPDRNVRAGLWVQSPNLAYTTRHHAAEETFFILGGHAIWQAGDAPEHRQGVGAQIHHASMVAHADCTQNAPLLAAWRWSGAVSIEQYTFKG